MAQSVIAALRVNLGLDSAQFQRGLKNSKSGMQRFKRQATVAFAAASAAAVGAFMAISGAAKRADADMKQSQALGITIEEMGRLRHAADLSGASYNDLERTIRRTSQAINNATQGISNTGTKSFDRLGVSLKDAEGNARSTEAVLGDVAEIFANMPDGATKTAMAVDMFGRSGAQMIPMLNQGRDGLKAMGDEAERLGLVFNERTGRASEQFNDNMLRLSRTMTGLWNQVLANVIDGFADLTTKIIASTQAGGGLDMAVQGISFAMNALVRSIGFVLDNMDALIRLAQVWIGMKLAVVVVNAGRAFYAFARAVQVAGVASAALSAITKGKILVFGTMVALIAEATGQLEPFTQKIQQATAAIINMIPEEWTEQIKTATTDLNNLWGRGFGEAEDALDSVNTALPEVAANAGGAAGALGTVGDAAAASGGLLERMGDVGRQVTSTLASGFTDLFTGMIDGTKSASQAIGDLLSQLGRLLLNNAFNMLFGSMFGGIGGGNVMTSLGMRTASFVPGTGWMSMDGGGFTGFGPRTGGLDGKGGIPAILHPNETVIDHTKGGAGSMVFHIDARGAQRGVGAEIARELRKQLPDAIQSYNRNPYRRAG